MPKTRFTDLDFKPRGARRVARAGKPRFTRLHLAIVAACAVSGIVLLTSTPDDASAVRGASARADAQPGASALIEQELALPAAGSRPLAAPAAAAPEPVAIHGSRAGQPATSPATAAEASDKQPADVAAAEDEAAEEPAEWHTAKVRSGDSLAAIFNRAGFDPRAVHEVLAAGEAAKSLTRIFPGDEISYAVDAEGELQALRYAVDESVTLHVDRAQAGYAATLVADPLERRVAHTSATIDSSLFLAGKDAGLNDGLIMELAGIFGWDIDFALDIRAGDQFSVIYEELYRDGERVRYGDIVAAEFISQGKRYRAVRYEDPDSNVDYYSPDGRSMRKAFLRSPVDFRRISSRFNPNRLHPKLGYKRPHRGVDYAASTGTPIRAAGDGKIVHRGRKGGYGNVVIIQHGSRYSTLYAHMSRFANGFRVGSRVKQGQTIGYVGASGLATGPHLHYEFRVDGVHRNPLTVSLPEAEPIPSKLRADFETQTAPLLAQLDAIGRTELAHSNQ